MIIVVSSSPQTGGRAHNVDVLSALLDIPVTSIAEFIDEQRKDSKLKKLRKKIQDCKNEYLDLGKYQYLSCNLMS